MYNISINILDTRNREISEPKSFQYYFQPRQEIFLGSGWNMFSLNVNSTESNVFDFLSPIHDNLLQVLNESGSAIFPSRVGFADNIGTWSNTEGYQIKVQEDVSLFVSNDGIINLPMNIPLTSGWNIISYPAQSSDNIESVLSSLIDSENLALVFNEAGNLYIPSYVTNGVAQNSINNFISREGYYVKVYNNDNLIISEPEFEFFDDNLIVENNDLRDEHFVPGMDG